MFKNLITNDQLLSQRLAELWALSRKTDEIHRDRSPLALGTHLSVMVAVLREAEWRLRDITEKARRDLTL